MDIAAPTGTPIKAPLAGRVVDVGSVLLQWQQRDHRSRPGPHDHVLPLVEDPRGGRQELKRGEVLGDVGATGRVTGPHLHWGVILNGVTVDPALFLAPPPSKKPVVNAG